MMAWNNQNLPVSKEPTVAVAKKMVASSAAGDAVTVAQFQQMIKDNPVLVIDFSATWCGPCKRLSPILEKMEHEFAGKVKVQKVDVDLSEELSRFMNIQGIPYVVKYVNGKKVNEMVGLETEDNVRKFFAK
ncbi:thioredoxin [compost metagenome]